MKPTVPHFVQKCEKLFKEFPDKIKLTFFRNSVLKNRLAYLSKLKPKLKLGDFVYKLGKLSHKSWAFLVYSIKQNFPSSKPKVSFRIPGSFPGEDYKFLRPKKVKKTDKSVIIADPKVESDYKEFPLIEDSHLSINWIPVNYKFTNREWAERQLVKKSYKKSLVSLGLIPDQEYQNVIFFGPKSRTDSTIVEFNKLWDITPRKLFKIVCEEIDQIVSFDLKVDEDVNYYDVRNIRVTRTLVLKILLKEPKSF